MEGRAGCYGLKMLNQEATCALCGGGGGGHCLEPTQPGCSAAGRTPSVPELGTLSLASGLSSLSPSQDRAGPCPPPLLLPAFLSVLALSLEQISAYFNDQRSVKIKLEPQLHPEVSVGSVPIQRKTGRGISKLDGGLLLRIKGKMSTFHVQLYKNF